MCEIINFISLIIPHRSLFEFIIDNCKRITLSQSVNLLMISVITPLLVTYVIAVEFIYMSSRELPPIKNNLNFCYLLFIQGVPKKKKDILNIEIKWQIINIFF